MNDLIKLRANIAAQVMPIFLKNIKYTPRSDNKKWNAELAMSSVRLADAIIEEIEITQNYVERKLSDGWE